MNIHSLKSITMWNLTEGCLTWGKLLHNMKFRITFSKETWTHPLSPFSSFKIGEENQGSCDLLSGLWLMPDFRAVTPLVSVFNFKRIWSQVNGSLQTQIMALPISLLYKFSALQVLFSASTLLYFASTVLSQTVLWRSWIIWKTSEVKSGPVLSIVLNDS